MKEEQRPSFHDVFIDTLHQFEILKWIFSFHQCGAEGQISYQGTADLNLIDGSGTELKTAGATVQNDLASQLNTTGDFLIVDANDERGTAVAYQETNQHNQICRKNLKHTDETVGDGEKEHTITDNRIWDGKSVMAPLLCEQIQRNDQNVRPLRQKYPWQMGPEIGIECSWDGNNNVKSGIANRKILLNTSETKIPGNHSEQGKVDSSNAHVIRTKCLPFDNVRSNHNQVRQEEDHVTQMYEILSDFWERLMYVDSDKHKDQRLEKVLTLERGKMKDMRLLNPKWAWDDAYDNLTQAPSSDKPSKGFSILEELNRFVSNLLVLTNFDPYANEYYVMKSEGAKEWVGVPNTETWPGGEGMPLVMFMKSERSTEELSRHHIDGGNIKSEIKDIRGLTLGSSTGTMEKKGYCSNALMLKDIMEHFCQAVKHHCELLMAKVDKKMALRSALDAEARERERLKSEKTILEKCLVDALNNAEEGIFMCDFCKEIVNNIEHSGHRKKNLQDQIDQVEITKFHEVYGVRLCGDSCIPLQDEAFAETKEGILKPQRSGINAYQISDVLNLQPKLKVSSLESGELKTKRKNISEEMCQNVDVNQKKTKHWHDISEENDKHYEGTQTDRESQDFFEWSTQMIQEIERDSTESHIIMAGEHIVDKYGKRQDEAQNNLEGTKILTLELETDSEDNVD